MYCTTELANTTLRNINMQEYFKISWNILKKMVTTLCFGGRIKLYLHSILGIACATIIECHSRLKVKSWDFACWLTMMCILQGRRKVQKLWGDKPILWASSSPSPPKAFVCWNEINFYLTEIGGDPSLYVPALLNTSQLLALVGGILSSPTPIRIIRNDWQSWK